MAALKDLLAQKAALDQQIEEATAHGRSEALTKIRALMEETGLTPADLRGPTPPSAKRAGTGKGSGRTGPMAGTKVAAKYRDSSTGETWSGRGLQPKWLKAALADGKKIEDFTI